MVLLAARTNEGVPPAFLPFMVGYALDCLFSHANASCLIEYYLFRNLDLRKYAFEVPMKAVRALGAVAKVHLGNGIVRVKAGESVPTQHSAQSWEDWRDGALPEGLSQDQRPDHPPDVAHGVRCYFVGRSYAADVVEHRNIQLRNDFSWASSVVVFQEGLAMPTSTLLRIVNKAHAVLVLRGNARFFYLHSDFVLSADEEESLVEWGIGRPLFANTLLAVGGVVLVAFAEKVWGPAVIGTLLVAAAVLRVQGAMTKALRIMSFEWRHYQLVPSGIHGVERAVQLLLVTLVALADLLDSKVLLLSALSFATLEVILLESIGQAVITWTIPKYARALDLQLRTWLVFIGGGLGLVFSAYVFAGAISLLVLLAIWVSSCVLCLPERPIDATSRFKLMVVVLVTVLAFAGMAVLLGATGWVAFLDVKEFDGFISVRPWSWPLTRKPDTLITWLRLPALWVAVVAGCLSVVFATVGLFSFRISSDRTDTGVPFDHPRLRGERTTYRQHTPIFVHYHENSIPSRNLLH